MVIFKNDGSSFETVPYLTKYWWFGKEYLSIKEIVERLALEKKFPTQEKMELKFYDEKIIMNLGKIELDVDIEEEFITKSYNLSNFGKTGFRSVYPNYETFLI